MRKGVDFQDGQSGRFLSGVSQASTSALSYQPGNQGRISQFNSQSDQLQQGGYNSAFSSLNPQFQNQSQHHTQTRIMQRGPQQQSQGSFTAVTYATNGNDSERQQSYSNTYSGPITQQQPRYERQFQLEENQVARATGTVINEQEDVYYQGMQVLSEQIVEHTITVPHKRTYEEIVEKVIVVPEKVQRSEIIEEKQTIREKVIHVAKPVEVVKYVDEIQYINRDVPVPVVVKQEQERLVKREVWTDEVVYKTVPKYIDREKVVEYEVTEVRHVPVPRTVEVPETRIIEKVVEKPINKIVEVEIPEYRTVEVMEEVARNVPVPMEHISHVMYQLPAIQTEYEEVPLPVFVPSFVEVPIPAEYLTEAAVLQSENLKNRIALAVSGGMPSLCVLEDLGNQARRMQPDLIDDPALLEQRMGDKIAKFHEHLRQETNGGGK